MSSSESGKESLKCYNCQAKLDFKQGGDIGRSEDCPSCHADLRCCKMCVFYDKSAYNECREPTADRIVDKEKANFCDFFKAGAKAGKDESKNDLLAAADALFKK